MQIAEVLRNAEGVLAQSGIQTAHLDALVLLESATGKEQAWLLAHSAEEIDSKALKQFNQLLAKRAQRLPIAYLTGEQEFYGLSFKVTPSVLIPRPETEGMVDEALKFPGSTARVLDVGTGCGTIAVAIAKHRPNWEITATDSARRALNIARANAVCHGVNIKFIKSDLFANVRGSFDVITANLPYLKTTAKTSPEVSREPTEALFAGKDGLGAYRRFFGQLAGYVHPGSHVIIEADPSQHQKLNEFAELAGLKPLARSGFILAFRC